MTLPLTTNGLVPVPEFPAAPYEEVHKKVVGAWATHAFYEHYAGAWNAVAYRFHGSFAGADAFDGSLVEHGASPEPIERYQQEQALFELFSNGFATFEAGFYALFTIGAFLDPAGFPLATEKDQQRVSPAQTGAAYRRIFAGDPIIAALDSLFGDVAYQQLREIRNVLTHRTAPGRRMFVSIGTEAAPPVEWKLKGITLDRSLAATRKAELARLLGELMIAVDGFVTRKI